MENETIVIEQVTEFSSEVAEAVRRLTPLIGDGYLQMSDEEIKAMILSLANRLFVAKNKDRIVGMISMVVYRIPYRTKAWAEDLVVDSSYQGKGIGKMLLQRVIDQAKKERVSSLMLTSDARHEPAHSLYEKLGFEKRDTNVYRMLIES